jgi:hypothetical protein
MTLLPLTTCAQMLGIHPKTLHSWLKEADLPLALYPTDARIKCLEEQHLQEVARRHDRSLPELSCALVSSEEQVTSLPATTPCEPDLMQKLSCLETKVATLQEQRAGLALALLAERERTLERRITAWETMMAEPLERPPSLPEGQMAVPTLLPAVVPHLPRALNPAELRARARLIPLIEYGAAGTYVVICPQEGELALTPDSPEWFGWFATLSSFRFVGQSGRFTAYRETDHGQPTRGWVAHRCSHNRHFKHWLAVTDRLSIARLEQMAARLQAHVDAL